MKKLLLLSLIALLFSGCYTIQNIYGPKSLLSRSKALAKNIKALDSTKDMNDETTAVDNLVGTNEDNFKTSAKNLRNYNRQWKQYSRRLARYKCIVGNRPYLNKLSEQLIALEKTLNSKKLSSNHTNQNNGAPIKNSTKKDSSSQNTIKYINSTLTAMHKRNSDWKKKDSTLYGSQLRKLSDSIKKLQDDSTWLSQVKDVINPDSIAVNRFSILGATYSNINSVPDNDAPGLSQYYFYVSIPFKQSGGLPNSSDNFVWFRNIYLQPTVNIGKYNALTLLDTVVNGKTQFHANKLDILQYAFIKTPTDLNILTYINHTGTTDYFHAYLALMGGLLITKDTIKNHTDLITSSMYGLGISAKSESGVSKSFTFEAGMRLFRIQSFQNTFSPDLNPQYRNYKADTLQQNGSTPFANSDNQWYVNLDFIAKYNLNLAKTGSTAFLHFDYYSNFPNQNIYHNTYFQVQLGVSFDFTSIFSSPSSSKPSSTGSSTTGK